LFREQNGRIQEVKNYRKFYGKEAGIRNEEEIKEI
jgi:hypothetical protein